MSEIRVDKISGKTSTNAVTVTGENGSTQTSLQQGLTKVWIHLDASSGTPTAQDSLNVSSLTDTAVGQHTVNINNDFNNADYANTVNSNFDGFFWCPTGYTASAFTINIYTGSGYSDRTEVIGKSCGELA